MADRFPADRVRETLQRHLLLDGFPIVLDLEASQGATLIDAATGTPYLDMFTFFASNALGVNHPGLSDDPAFTEELLEAARNKVSNSDVYTAALAAALARANPDAAFIGHVRFANRYAALSTERPGAALSMPALAEVQVRFAD